MGNLYKKLHKIQSQINGLGKNKKSHNYTYVNGDKVLSHIKPLMNDLGLILKQEVISIDNERQDYKTKYGEKSEILSKVMMRFTWIDVESGEKDENLFGANGQNDWEKGLGSALTYAERYFLLKYFHIATDEDDIDNPNRKKEVKVATENTPKPSIQKNTEPTQWLNVESEQWKALEKAVDNGESFTISQIRKKYKVSKETATKLENLGIS